MNVLGVFVENQIVIYGMSRKKRVVLDGLWVKWVNGIWRWHVRFPTKGSPWALACSSQEHSNITQFPYNQPINMPVASENHDLQCWEKIMLKSVDRKWELFWELNRACEYVIRKDICCLGSRGSVPFWGWRWYSISMSLFLALSSPGLWTSKCGCMVECGLWLGHSGICLHQEGSSWPIRGSLALPWAMGWRWW